MAPRVKSDKSRQQIALEESLKTCEKGNTPEKNCVCRCKSTCHGLQRGSSTEFFESLPSTDPHSFCFDTATIISDPRSKRAKKEKKDMPMNTDIQLSIVPFSKQKGTIDIFASLDTLPTVELAESDEQSTVQAEPVAMHELVEWMVGGRKHQPNRRQIPILNWVAEDEPGKHAEVIAGPGVGKTFTLEDIAALTKERDSIMLAFNASIANELDKRLRSRRAIPEASTMHRLGLGALRKSLGKNITVDNYNQKYYNIAKSLLVEHYIKDPSLAAPLRKLTSMAMLRYVEPTEENLRTLALRYQQIDLDPQRRFIEWSKVWPLVAEMLRLGQEQADHLGIVNFDDMLYLAVKWSRPDAPEKYRLRLPIYGRIGADEGQDFNPLQQKLLLGCLDPMGKAIIVGDPKQAIYQFTGADTKSMETMQRILHAEVFLLDINYRSEASIIREFNTIFPDQPVYPRPDAGEGKVEHLPYEEMVSFFTRPEFHGKTKMGIARTNRDLVEAYLELIRSGVPAYINGREVGSSLIELLGKLSKAAQYNARDLHNLGFILLDYERVQTESYAGLPDAEMKLMRLTDQVNTMAAVLQAFFDKVPDRWNQNEDNFKMYLKEFFGVTGEKGAKQIGPRKGIQLLTGHGSKGLEAQVVGVFGPENVPHPAAKTPEDIDAERCVKYVMFSRPQEVMGLLHKDGRDYGRPAILEKQPEPITQRSFLDEWEDEREYHPF